ncbi:MAG TPA: uroporphyrinogen-III synthase [Chlamydiales bacterium]|nr:uroporphyrinogen-III synthase [Chlamydiales bacterium]
MNTLYLGLNPTPGTFHYPVIRTVYCANLEPALALWPLFTHIIFTSQTAVHYWPGPWDKHLIAIGAATATALKGKEVLIAPEATQEGIIALIRNIDGYFFLPRSRLTRPTLTDFMTAQKIPHFALTLYDTIFQKLEPVPNLADFDEIVFTSPSTVEGFLRIYGKLPNGIKLTPIGPITAGHLQSLSRH